MISWTHYDQPVAHATLHFYRRATNRSKPPLVFCHGFSDNGLCFRRVAEVLAPNYDVILVDTRNHGQSSSGEATADDLVEDLAEFVEALGLAPATFIGHSMGAGIVALLASRYPKSVRRIVLEDPAWFDTPLKNGAHSSEKHLAAAQKHIKDLAALTEKQLMALGRQLHPDWSEIEFPDWLTAKQQVHIMAAGGLERANWRELVPTITCPALLLYGDKEAGALLTPSIVEEILNLAPQTIAAHVPGAGHNIRREQFDRYLACLTQFLEHD